MIVNNVPVGFLYDLDLFYEEKAQKFEEMGMPLTAGYFYKRARSVRELIQTKEKAK